MAGAKSRAESKVRFKTISKIKSKTGSFQPSRPKALPARTAAPSVLSDAKTTIRRLKAELAQALKRIDQLQAFADTDFLLDVYNRRGFERELVRSISYIKRYQANGALIVLDVDRLKPINDTYGHAAGDEVLKAIVAGLRSPVRSSDVIGRLGGDEFALLLWNLSETDAHAKAAMLEDTVDRMIFVFRGHKVTSGVSTGVVLLGRSCRSRQGAGSRR